MDINKKNLIIVGTGANARHCYSFVRYHDLFNIKCFAVDRQYLGKASFCGCPVYPLEEIKNYYEDGNDEVFVALLWNHLNSDRKNLYERLRGGTAWPISSPRAP